MEEFFEQKFNEWVMSYEALAVGIGFLFTLKKLSDKFGIKLKMPENSMSYILSFFKKEAINSFSLKSNHIFGSLDGYINKMHKFVPEQPFDSAIANDAFMFYSRTKFEVLRELIDKLIDENSFNNMNQSQFAAKIVNTLITDYEREIDKRCEDYFKRDLQMSNNDALMLIGVFDRFQRPATLATFSTIRLICYEQAYASNRIKVLAILALLQQRIDHNFENLNRAFKEFREDVKFVK